MAPFIPEDDYAGSHVQAGVHQFPAATDNGDTDRPSFWRETLPAAWRTSNTVGSAVAGLENSSGHVAPGFDPFARLVAEGDTRMMAHADAFTEVFNEDDYGRMKARLHRELKDRETIEAAGWQGMVAGLGAGLVDPINFIPVGGTAYRAGRSGLTIAKSAATTARAGLASSAAAEVLLHATQETRTGGETAANITAATLLSGVLGGAAPLVREGFLRGRDSVRGAMDRRAIGKMYDAALSDPAGRTVAAPDQHVMKLGNDAATGLERVLVDRGEGVLRENGSVGVRTNYGLVKVIWRHGVESPEAARVDAQGMVVTRSDVLALPQVLRRFVPEMAEDTDVGFQRWQWAVEREGADGVARPVIYSIRRFINGDGGDHVVTIYVPRPGEDVKLSAKVGRRGAGTESPSEGLRPVQDTAAGPSSQPQRGQHPAPETSIAPAAPDVTAPNGSTLAGAARDGALPDHGDHLSRMAAAVERDLVSVQDDAPMVDVVDVSGHPSGSPDGEAAGHVLGEGGSVGAAAVHDSTLGQETLKGALGVERLPVVKHQDPLMRSLWSPSVVVRRIVQQLAETPLVLSKNTDGIASPIAVETRMKMAQGPLAEGLTTVDDAFVRYRLGRARQRGDLLKIGTSDALSRKPGVMLDRKAFLEEVGKAMRRDDAHDIPEVAEAARAMRQTVFDPWKDRAIAAGLLPEDVTTDTAPSYLTRVYNVERIVRRRPEFENRITEWLRGVQENAGARMREAEDKAKALAPKIEALEADLSRLDGRRQDGQPGDILRAKSEWQRWQREAALRDRDLRALRREVRQATWQAEQAARRLDEFAPTPALERDDPFRRLLADLRRNVNKPPPSLSAWVRKNGGLRDEGGEARGHGLADYRLVNDKSGMDLDDAARSAWEAGYFSGHGDERPSIADFLWALRDDAAGTAKLYRDADLDAVAYLDYLADIRRQMDELGIGLDQPNAKIKALILAQGDDAAGQRFRASTPATRARAAEIAYHQKRAGQRLADARARLATVEAAARDAVEKREVARLDFHGLSARRSDLDAQLSKARTALERAQRSFDAERLMAGMEHVELKDIARQITDGLVGGAPGRTSYQPFQVATKRGPMMERTLSIPDADIEDFLESDVGVVARIYTRTMAADVSLAETFGRADMADQIAKIGEHYALLREGVTDEKRLADLDQRMKADMRDIAAIRDRIRGQYGLPNDPNGLVWRAFRVVRNVNYLRQLGGMTLSAIPDPARVVMVHGLSRGFRHGLVPMVRGLRAYKLAAEEANLAGTALDMVLDSRAMQLADVFDDYGRLSTFERGVQALTSKYGLVSLMAPWNTAMKQMVGVVTQTRMLQAVARYGELQPGSAELERLSFLGIDANLAQRIGAQFSRHGEKDTSGIWWANSRAWTDGEAVEGFRTALVKEIDRTIVSPGQDKPLWMSTELGKLVGQFKSFSFASTQRTALAALQQRDMAVLNGAVLSVGLGMVSFALHSAASGRPTPTDPRQWVAEGFDRSGLLFWLSDAGNLAGRFTGWGMTSRHASRTPWESVLGPSAGLVSDAWKVGATTVGKDTRWSASDTHAVRRMLPYQNLFYLRQLLDTAEEGVNSTFGVPNRAATRTPPR
mgnify:FL=1